MQNRSAPGPSAGASLEDEIDSGVATMELVEGFARPK